MFLTISDEEKPIIPNGPHFRVIALMPECVKRLKEKLARYWDRRRVR
jgi:hypothetical protein